MRVLFIVNVPLSEPKVTPTLASLVPLLVIKPAKPPMLSEVALLNVNDGEVLALNVMPAFASIMPKKPPAFVVPAVDKSNSAFKRDTFSIVIAVFAVSLPIYPPRLPLPEMFTVTGLVAEPKEILPEGSTEASPITPPAEPPVQTISLPLDSVQVLVATVKAPAE